MRLHRFYVSNPIGEDRTVILNDSALAHQLKNVFRFTVGGQVILFDNSGIEYRAMIADLQKGSVTFSIVSSREGLADPKREVHLYVSLIKKDKMEWILEKGTELGVSVFIPIVSDRSEKKNLNMERAQRILQESSEQSGRTIIPQLREVATFDEMISQDFPCFAFHPKGDVFTVEHAQNYSPLGIFIGPEGGWSDREVFLFKQNNIRVYSLGEQTLRAETAAVAISSLILLQ